MRLDYRARGRQDVRTVQRKYEKRARIPPNASGPGCGLGRTVLTRRADKSENHGRNLLADSSRVREGHPNRPPTMN